MRRELLFCVALAACISPSSSAAGNDLHGELDSLAKQVQDQARQLDNARDQNRVLKERIDALERRMADGAMPANHSADLVDNAERLDSIEAQALVALARQEGVLDRLGRSVETTGYAAVHFQNFDEQPGEFTLATLELLFDAHPTDRVSFRGEIEFEANGPEAAKSNQAVVEIEQAWVEYAITPWFKPRAGVIIVPFGLYSTQHFDTVRDLTARPLLARRIVPTTWSETGVGATGAIALSEWGSNHHRRDLGIEYEAYLINGLTDRISDTSTRAARGAQRGDNNDNKAVAGRLAFSSTGLFNIGVSGYQGKYDPSDEHAIVGFAGDWDLHYGPLRLLGEYAQFEVERGLSDTGLSMPRSLEGFYIEPSYTFWPKLLDPLKPLFLANPTVTAVARWGFAEIDVDDADTGNNREERLTLGLNLRPTDSLVLKFEWQRNTTARDALEHGDSNGFLTSLAASF